MICFRDKTFCGSDCAKADCHRFFGPEQQAEAQRWWGSPGAPVAFSDFSDRCSEYQPRDTSARQPSPRDEPLLPLRNKADERPD